MNVRSVREFALQTLVFKIEFIYKTCNAQNKI